MDGIGKRIAALIEETEGMSGAKLGRMLRPTVSRTTVSAWCRGRVASLKSIYTAQITTIFGVERKWLETGFGPKRADERPKIPSHERGIPAYDVPQIGLQVRRIPLLKWEQASVGALGDGETVAIVAAATLGPRVFALRQQGDAMAPDIQDGELVILDPDSECVHGHIVLALRPNDLAAVMRRLSYDGGVPFLRASNPAYPTLDMPPETVILGRVVFSQKTH